METVGAASRQNAGQISARNLETLAAASRQSTAQIRARNMETAADLFPPSEDNFIIDQFGRRVRKTQKPTRKAFEVYRDPPSTKAHTRRTGF
jgi:hypothetical protein